MADALTFLPVDGIGEITSGDDIGAIVARTADLRDGDVVIVTSKIVSKALGLATHQAKEDLLTAETDRVVASIGATQIVRTHHGLTMAAAGIDGSNTAPGTILSLPKDPDLEARRLRKRICEITGRTVGVVITDTVGRAWRVGQTDLAIGCAGVLPFESFGGRSDTHGQPLFVTAPAVADEIAAAADLVAGKLGGRPVVVARGIAKHLLNGEDGPGAAALIRDEDDDVFGLGARDAVVEAVHHSGTVVRGFPASEATLDTVIDLADIPATITVERPSPDHLVLTAASDDVALAGRLAERLEILATAHRIEVRVDVNVT